MCRPRIPAEAKRQDNFAGSLSAHVVEVIDGDRFLAEAEIWPGQTLRVNIRICGIDAPEMKSRCVGERTARHAQPLPGSSLRVR
ncbi:hypothetical protein GCM10010836_30390 [Aminobacter aminovorans]